MSILEDRARPEDNGHIAVIPALDVRRWREPRVRARRRGVCRCTNRQTYGAGGRAAVSVEQLIRETVRAVEIGGRIVGKCAVGIQADLPACRCRDRRCLHAQRIAVRIAVGPVTVVGEDVPRNRMIYSATKVVRIGIRRDIRDDRD